MPTKLRVCRAAWMALALVCPSMAVSLACVRRAAAQSVGGECAPPPAAGDPLVGMVQAATPLLREQRCGRPVARTELTTHLADVDRLRTLDERRLPQTATTRASLLSSVLGSRDDAPRDTGFALADTLSNVLTVGMTTWQLASDVSLHDRASLTDDATLEILLADALAHALSQGIALAVRSGAEGDCAPGDQACEAASLRPSGRVAMAFTSASLMCLHRQMAGGVDLGECAGAMALAAGVGAMRLLTEEHDALDVLLGAGIGLMAGYLVPLGTLYAFGARRAHTRIEGHEHHELEPEDDADVPRGDWGVRATIAPSFSTSRGIGLRLAGTF